MKSWLTIFAAVSFLAIAVFGVLAMNNGAHDGCIASATWTCAAGNVFALGSVALFAATISSALIFFSLLRQRSLAAAYFQNRQVHFWLALHEKRDPAFSL